ncbi:hypothetical protein AB6A40_004191 [Gnathostoma spinigerum]|uniref:Uncharacterized protein n=1 Tax=Gnathostoma spinigerum TaxID=75299 RepID=A0ABD6ELN7_9BILA
MSASLLLMSTFNCAFPINMANLFRNADLTPSLSSSTDFKNSELFSVLQEDSSAKNDVKNLSTTSEMNEEQKSFQRMESALVSRQNTPIIRRRKRRFERSSRPKYEATTHWKSLHNADVDSNATVSTHCITSTPTTSIPTLPTMEPSEHNLRSTAPVLYDLLSDEVEIKSYRSDTADNYDRNDISFRCYNHPNGTNAISHVSPLLAVAPSPFQYRSNNSWNSLLTAFDQPPTTAYLNNHLPYELYAAHSSTASPLKLIPSLLNSSVFGCFPPSLFIVPSAVDTPCVQMTTNSHSQ